MHFFFALNHVEFSMIKNFKTTYEIWKLLEVTYEVTSQVNDYI